MMWSRGLVFVAAAMWSGSIAAGDVVRESWPEGLERTWVGPEYFATRLQDWRVREGRVECVEGSRERPMRVLHVLPVELGGGGASIRVELGPIAEGGTNADAWAGVLIGCGGEGIDYRLTALVHHRPAEDGGVAAVVDAAGRVAFRDNETPAGPGGQWAVTGPLDEGELAEIPATSRTDSGMRPDNRTLVHLEIEPEGATYALTLTATNGRGDLLSRATLAGVDRRLVEGGLGLVSHLAPAGGEIGYWFDDLGVEGPGARVHADRAFGPVVCAQHTLSRGTLKLTAQLMPIGAMDTPECSLQVDRGRGWETVATAPVDPDAYTCEFRVEDWDGARETRYRVVYELAIAGGETRTHTWEGRIRAEPVDDDEIVVAAFTGNKNYTGGLKWNSNGIWFPHNELVAAVRYHDPDFLFFSGDQVYEGDLTGAQRRPPDKAMLDYLDKWYRWCWAFGDLTRDRPSVTIPDDHDVYHGNLWGAGGRHAERQDDGGYTMPARFVNMVQRTQTSHLPDPYDPTPVEQGVGVYYTSVEYAGVSFAVIEDRKFKDSATPLVPEGRVVNGWFQNREFDPRNADVPGARLLGDRQLAFLNDWATDWAEGTWMKVVLSQTIFANVATLPADAMSDNVVPSLEYYGPGEYPPDDRRVADCDSNGWPQAGRNRALREMRRGFAFHIAGDQHLGSFIHYGVDDFDDAGYALCVPSIGNTWPRRWYPSVEGRNRAGDAPRYTGQYLDGFGNHMTVLAVSNPVRSGHEPAGLYDRAPGYGIVRLDRITRDITAECWPRWVDPSEAGARQYLGWPVTISQLDNYRRGPYGFLPTIVVSGVEDPVIRVIRQETGEVVYALRVPGQKIRPKVFEGGTYAVEVGEPGTEQWRVVPDLRPGAGDGTIRIEW